MGHKVNPTGFRVGISQDWRNRWFADKKAYAKTVLEDYKIREYLRKKLRPAGLKSLEIERSVNEISIFVKVSRPGVVIGRGGTGADVIKDELKKLTNSKISFNVEEVKVPEIEAQIVADNIASQIERRVPFKRASKMAIDAAMEKGAKGIKIRCSGLLSGANTIARTETLSRGSIPSQTLRAIVDFAAVDSKTLFGIVGVKVWIYKGEVKGQVVK
ncbi:30S ribosomal protein S3 [candidate division WWE3 bacterium]|nr:30S ribosomal protein S3 [candidate division WWE3 bacterium]